MFGCEQRNMVVQLPNVTHVRPRVQVYHKPPEAFVSRTRLAVAKAEDLQAERAEEEGEESTGAPSTSGAEVCDSLVAPTTLCCTGFDAACKVQGTQNSGHAPRQVI